MDIIKKRIRSNGKRADRETFNARIREAQNGSLTARNWCVEQNLALVLKQAGKFRYNYEDAFQEGVIGLMRAIETYDPAKGFFSTYAMPWIKQRMRRFHEDNRTPVRFPNYLIQLNRTYNKLKAEHPDEDDMFYVRLMAKLKGVDPKTVLWAARLNDRDMFKHLDAENDEGHKILEFMASHEDTPSDQINFQKLFKVLTYQEKFILIERAHGMTLEGCANELGCSREWIRLMEQNAILKVRAAIRLRNKSYLFNKENKNAKIKKSR
jgi:RNA polymerase sigma factor (sigma-70 family)